MTGAARHTIFALSSGGLPSGIAVVRISGPAAFEVLAQLTGAPLPTPRVASLRRIADPASRQLIDTGLILAFPGPQSATGEDIAELHVHGGPAVVAALLAAIGAHPHCRLAQPGEFTRRAFDAGKLDLSQVEGLADLTAAETHAQHVAALSQSGGSLRTAVEGWQQQLIGALAETEAAIDFAEAEDDVATRLGDDAAASVAGVIEELEQALADGVRARQLRDGLTIVVSGPPNVGKSSLVNALARSDVSIVSATPGTTRDLVSVRLDLGGVAVTLIDTAGLRDTDDEIEAEGVSRARARIADADLVLALFCGDTTPGSGLPLRTKVDVFRGDGGELAVSSLTGEGLEQLTDWLGAWARQTSRPDEPALLMRQRQRDACATARSDLAAALIQTDPVLRAESLRLAIREFGSITGLVRPDAVFDAIFSQFCIGK
jgi:tRNA modification GTPase